MHPDFRYPGITTIDGRTSSITAAFFKAITPVIQPSEIEVDEVLEILGMARGECTCSYCGDAHSEWDHFRPVVVGKRPTGFITEIANMVPSCGKCNQSKGAKNWKTWIRSSAKWSPSTRGKKDVDLRVERLNVFEGWRTPICINYESTVGSDQWATYLQKLDAIAGLLKAAQIEAIGLRTLININSRDQSC